MAGHSKFANIKHRKAAQDSKRAKVFTRLIREITVAAKSGDDVDSNPRLRAAIIAAKAANMPKDRIENAVKKGSGGDIDDSYEELRYEGYGPAGTALIVEALTDNRNRTASAVRTIFNKNGGNLGETGSVSFMFERKGILRFPKDNINEDEIFELAVEAGADSVDNLEEFFEISTETENFALVRDVILKRYDNPEFMGLAWLAQNNLELDQEKLEQLHKLIDALDDDDDVQDVYVNV
ncbi:MAG: YebC/PmpR family DNA-binding transcriptional regulator [Alphaproteobacteria bacterium]|jgi:YebC/PmpR family DNA-binding regulatory protein|nr:YebC/PmpR family DNA-binding transcriptional regulator [Alphaproteobacteria bacterium]MBT5828301.1 YebC/PmpR family DNA-binding transcriptional regulator [Alphaproteobacteria bacterium]